MKSMRTWFVVAGFALVALEFFNPSSPAVFAADVTSTWSTATSGNWNVNANWTNVPAMGGFPNNGNGGVATYDATINAGRFAVHRDTQHERDGRRSVAELCQCNLESHVRHAHRHRSDQSYCGHIQPRGRHDRQQHGQRHRADQLDRNAGNTLSGVTVNGDLNFLSDFNSKVVIAGGTTFSTAHLAGNYSTIGFAPAQTLSARSSSRGPAASLR